MPAPEIMISLAFWSAWGLLLFVAYITYLDPCYATDIDRSGWLSTAAIFGTVRETIEEFLARGGKVTKVGFGVSNEEHDYFKARSRAERFELQERTKGLRESRREAALTKPSPDPGRKPRALSPRVSAIKEST